MAHPANELVIIFLFVSLTIGTLVTYFLSRFSRVPYTVVIFLIGIIWAIGFSYTDHSDILYISLQTWDEISPELILYIFLPALLFGESMSLNIHNVKGNI